MCLPVIRVLAATLAHIDQSKWTFARIHKTTCPFPGADRPRLLCHSQSAQAVGFGFLRRTPWSSLHKCITFSTTTIVHGALPFESDVGQSDYYQDSSGDPLKLSSSKTEQASFAPQDKSDRLRLLGVLSTSHRGLTSVVKKEVLLYA